jgi:hypothetical protein
MVVKMKYRFLSCIIIFSGICLSIHLANQKDITNSEDKNTKKMQTESSSKASEGYKLNTHPSILNSNLLISSQSAKSHTEADILNAKREQIFEYSREGNFPDTQALSKKAYDLKIISEKEYYGELAHMLSISVTNPEFLVKEIIRSGNQYGFEVMISNLSANDNLAKSIDSKQRFNIHNDLAQNKPKIEGYIGDLGLIDIYRYENWIGAMKNFSSNEEKFILDLNDLIKNKITDPREAFGLHALLYEGGYENKIDEAARKKYQFYVGEYLRSYPENKVSTYIANGK